MNLQRAEQKGKAQGGKQFPTRALGRIQLRIKRAQAGDTPRETYVEIGEGRQDVKI